MLGELPWCFMLALLFAPPCYFDGGRGPLGPDGGRGHVGQNCKLPTKFADVKMCSIHLPYHDSQVLMQAEKHPAMNASIIYHVTTVFHCETWL